jgi:hypothetical protein
MAASWLSARNRSSLTSLLTAALGPHERVRASIALPHGVSQARARVAIRAAPTPGPRAAGERLIATRYRRTGFGLRGREPDLRAAPADQAGASVGWPEPFPRHMAAYEEYLLPSSQLVPERMPS